MWCEQYYMECRETQVDDLAYMSRYLHVVWKFIYKHDLKIPCMCTLLTCITLKFDQPLEKGPFCAT